MIVLLAIFSLIAPWEEEMVPFFYGEQAHQVRAHFPVMGRPPYVSLHDFLKAIGVNGPSGTPDPFQIKVNHRPISLLIANNKADLGWKQMNCFSQVRNGEIYVRADSLTHVFSELLGRPMIYEPTSKTMHLPRSEDLNVDLRFREVESYWRLSFTYSREVPEPSLTRKGNMLIVRLDAAHVVLNREEFKPNELITALEPFLNLPDKTTELHFKLGEGVAHRFEPFSPRAGISAVRVWPEQEEQKEVPVEEAKTGIRRIVIDPGHGGHDEGARGPTGLKEKEVTLDLGKRLQTELEKSYEVQLTREDDFALPLKVRSGFANNADADVFISIHVNAVKRRDIWGSETFYLSLEGQPDPEDAYIVDFENSESTFEDLRLDEAQALEGSDPDLELILWDLAQTEYVEDSFRLAKYVQEELNILAGIRNRGVKQAPLKVLKGARMPAILVEVAFISNPTEENKLRNNYFKDQIVKSITTAIDRYDRDIIMRSRGQEREDAQ